MLILPTTPFLAFFEGFALILSPCILPVLPLVLAGSIVGNKQRPFLIILGFIFSFSFFALLSRQIIVATNIPQDVIQITAYALLLCFGLILLIPYLDNRFSAYANLITDRADNLILHKENKSIWSGLLLGILIGIIWTPCAGPLLAAALIQVLQSQTSFSAVITIIAFGLGAGIPILIIALFGQQLIHKIKFLARYTYFIRRFMGLIIILAALAGVTGNNPGAWVVTPANAVEINQPAPEIAGITQWFNSAPLTQKDLKGKVVLVDFWTYSCINCIRTLPILENWYEKYKDKNFVIIGVHAPEFPFEQNPHNVAAAIKKFGITYPVAMDNNYVTWRNFDNQYWPAHFLINQQGYVVDEHFAEGNYSETENKIRELLNLSPAIEKPDALVTSVNQTPETYLGYTRAERFESPEIVAPDFARNYSLPKNLRENHWALKGSWIMSKDHITAQNTDCALQFNFTAGKAYLVLGTESNTPITVDILLNHQPYKTITVDQHRLYELASQSSVKNGLLEIHPLSPGLEAYAFTFGK